jgi:hypothetical protein
LGAAISDSPLLNQFELKYFSAHKNRSTHNLKSPEKTDGTALGQQLPKTRHSTNKMAYSVIF